MRAPRPPPSIPQALDLAPLNITVRHAYAASNVHLGYHHTIGLQLPSLPFLFDSVPPCHSCLTVRSLLLLGFSTLYKPGKSGAGDCKVCCCYRAVLCFGFFRLCSTQIDSTAATLGRQQMTRVMISNKFLIPDHRVSCTVRCIHENMP